jgi:hypothetical protein
LHFLIDITCTASSRGVQTTITIPPAGKESDHLKTVLAVIDPSVLDRERRTRQHDLCVKEIELPAMQVVRALDGVERDLHRE